MEEGSTSGVSTVNSVKSQKTTDSVLNNKYWQEYHDQMSCIKVENMKLLHELIESQKTYQSLLCHALEEQKSQLGLLTEVCENINKKILTKNLG